MKIGIVTEYFYPTLGGITENIYHFSRELLRLGHDFRIITGAAQNRRVPDLQTAERILEVGRSMPVFFNGSCAKVSVGFGMKRRLRELLADEQFDLLHLHSPLFPTLPMLATIYSDLPIAGTFHTCTNAEGDLYYRLYQKRCHALLRRMNVRIAVSSCCAQENQRYQDMPFEVIPNGVDVDWWVRDAKPIERFCDGTFNLLFLGRPDTRNGLDTLIHAFARVHRKNPKTRLIIVGDGPLRFYFEGLVSPDLRHAVFFEGAAHEKRPQYLATADAFCFTPMIASFGITILEGMSAGKAIIASNIKAFRDLVTHGESALLVEPGNEDELVAAISRLIEDRTLRCDLAATAAKRVLRYDWKRVAKQQIACYQRMLGSSPAESGAHS